MTTYPALQSCAPNPSKNSLTVRDAVIDLLRAFGMTTIFGNPGSTELPMFRNFPHDFRYILGLQESAVLAMADGFAQASRNAAIVNLHSSAGVGHALGNLFTAYRNQTPLVVTAGQQARSILPYEPFLFAQQATEFPRPFIKWACEPARAEDVPAAIARAYYVAMQPPRGPTFVSIPVDDWDRLCEPVSPRKVSREIRGDAAMLADCAEALATAERPVIVVGAGVARDDAWDETVALAERHDCPVWVSPLSGRCGFPEDHRLFAGFLGAAREQIVQQLDGHDLIVVLGAPVFTYHVEGAGPFLPERAKLVLLSDDPAVSAWAPVGEAITVSLKPGIEALLAGPPPRPRPAPSIVRHRPVLSGTPFTDAYVLQELARLRPADSIIVEEAPSTRGPMHDHLPILRHDSFYTCASGGLGYGLPASVGVALAKPQQKVIALLGDGSSMYGIQGLWTAAQLRSDILFLIIKNGRYEALVSFGPHFGLQQVVGTELPSIDFLALAHGLGMPAAQVSRAADLEAALRESLATRGPSLLELVVD